MIRAATALALLASGFAFAGELSHKSSYSAQSLKERGIGLCIDDFGTGYSSLSYLNSFPIDTLKIDRSFVSQVDHDGSSLELIETIVALSRVLGMSAVAEGVETPEQLELVRRLGSHYAQGYYFAVPLDIRQAEELLLENLVW